MYLIYIFCISLCFLKSRVSFNMIDCIWLLVRSVLMRVSIIFSAKKMGLYFLFAGPAIFFIADKLKETFILHNTILI